MPARKVVFVVDDDLSILKAIKRVLNIHGFDAELFESVEDFHSRAKISKAICLVLDVYLNGASGIELKRQLAVAGVSVPVIFITGKDAENTRRAAAQIGCIAYLVKPFPAKSLIAAIVKASNGRVENE